MSWTTLASIDRLSALVPDGDGIVKLSLVQAASGTFALGRRDAFSEAQRPATPTERQVEACRRLLGRTRPGTLTVIPFVPGLAACELDLLALAGDRTIVGLAGPGGDGHNWTLIATGATLIKQAKISLSSDDEAIGMKVGRELNIFRPADFGPREAVRWTVLNCHDYSHVDVVGMIQEQQVELLVVVNFNAATSLFTQYAVADVHRLFCYVVVANVSELGGSGVFAPFRRIGQERSAQIRAGGHLFSARGPGEFQVPLDLDIAALRALRAEFITRGFRARSAQRLRSNYEPMVPSQHYMDTLDRTAGPPECDGALDIRTDWNVERPRIAIAQLDHIGTDAYLGTRYRIRTHLACSEFEHQLVLRLFELEARCRRRGRTDAGTLLDLLVFPEVFIPRSFLMTLQGFSDRLGAIVVAGLDYPDGGEAENANECSIIRPHEDPLMYRKITRSQYDAVRTEAGDRMPMLRGRQLVRFVNEDGRGFGVLICYDFSHFDLMWTLNLWQRQEPLDMTVVVAHNPFGELYRSGCIADAHRFYQYVVMCNVAEYGGSGVFGPIRGPGARQVLFETGQGVESMALAELPLGGLHRARRTADHQLHHGDFMRRPGLFHGRLRTKSGGSTPDSGGC